MADQFYDDIPAVANQISNDIDQIEKTLGFIKDILQNFLISFSNTDATVAFPAYVELDESPSSDHTAYGIKVQLQAGENLVFGNVCYNKSDGKLWKADANASTTMPAMAMAIETISADAYGDFLLFGMARDDTWNNTLGSIMYVSGTAGGVTKTAPSSSGDQVQAIGIATHANRIFFNFSLVLVEV